MGGGRGSDAVVRRSKKYEVRGKRWGVRGRSNKYDFNKLRRCLGKVLGSMK